MNIREMTYEDVEAVFEIECEAFSVPWSYNALKDEVGREEAIYLVAEEKNGVIGYAGLRMILDEAEITNIAVKKEWRGAGAGNLLLTELLQKAWEKGIVRVILEVRASNSSAQHLYKKHGFKQMAVRKHYYSKPQEDGCIMECLLK